MELYHQWHIRRDALLSKHTNSTLKRGSYKLSRHFPLDSTQKPPVNRQVPRDLASSNERWPLIFAQIGVNRKMTPRWVLTVRQ